MKQIVFALLSFLTSLLLMSVYSQSMSDDLPIIKCTDFKVSGEGTDPQWQNSSWVVVPALPNSPERYTTKIKVMYSSTGLYVLADCEDGAISTDFVVDQGDIWKGDVFEVFLQTDPTNPLYFEYELNPLNAELVILVPNDEGNFFGWSPWHYEGERKVQKAVKIHGGTAKPGEKISSWTAEIFFPFALFKALKNVPPTTGTVWKGNFCRMDYDDGVHSSWAWKAVNKSFHEYKRYGSLRFE